MLRPCGYVTCMLPLGFTHEQQTCGAGAIGRAGFEVRSGGGSWNRARGLGVLVGFQELDGGFDQVSVRVGVKALIGVLEGLPPLRGALPRTEFGMIGKAGILGIAGAGMADEAPSMNDQLDGFLGGAGRRVGLEAVVAFESLQDFNEPVGLGQGGLAAEAMTEGLVQFEEILLEGGIVGGRGLGRRRRGVGAAAEQERGEQERVTTERNQERGKRTRLHFAAIIGQFFYALYGVTVNACSHR